ncbi:MAG: alpha/beta hydrolase fold protein [Frankiales bacterium]|nr:alpha/beta hydrolase fold protein [Frankiales bacterium]
MTALPTTELGDGPPLLLLHGLGSSRRDWASLQPLLAAHFRTLAVDLPGQGEAEPLPVRPTVSALTDRLERDLDSRGLDRLHVLGNSLGGRLALELARRGRASSVVAISPSGTSFPPERLVQGAGFVTAGVMTRVLRPVLPALSRSALGRTALLANLRLLPWRASPTEAQALGEGFGSSDLWRLVLWSTLLDVPPSFRGVDCPVTLAQGTHDWIATGQTPRYLPLVRGAQLRVLPLAGHAPMTDSPGRIVRLVRETASRTTSTGGADPAS